VAVTIRLLGEFAVLVDDRPVTSFALATALAAWL
jgi:hypothetical protein